MNVGGVPPQSFRGDSLDKWIALMPEYGIDAIFILYESCCLSVGAFIGRPHGEPPYPIREDSL